MTNTNFSIQQLKYLSSYQCRTQRGGARGQNPPEKNSVCAACSYFWWIRTGIYVRFQQVIVMLFDCRLMLISDLRKHGLLRGIRKLKRNEISPELLIKIRVCIHFVDLNSELFVFSNTFGRLSSRLSVMMIINAIAGSKYRIFFIWNYYRCLILLIFGRFSMTVILI